MDKVIKFLLSLALSCLSLSPEFSERPLTWAGPRRGGTEQTQVCVGGRWLEPELEGPVRVWLSRRQHQPQPLPPASVSLKPQLSECWHLSPVTTSNLQKHSRNSSNKTKRRGSIGITLCDKKTIHSKEAGCHHHCDPWLWFLSSVRILLVSGCQGWPGSSVS